MKKYVLFILIPGVIFLPSEKMFSQVVETGSNNSELFNKDGYVRGITTARAIGSLELALGLSNLIMAIRSSVFGAFNIWSPRRTTTKPL